MVQTTILTPAGRAAFYPSPHYCECSLRVIDHGDGFVAVSDCGSMGCTDIELTSGQVTLWELSGKKLGRAVAKALDCEVKDVDLGIANTRQVGAFGSSALPVVLTIQHEGSHFANVVRQLVGQIGGGFVLLAPTSRFVDANSRGLLEKAKAVFVDLETNLTLLEKGEFQADRNGAELFKAHLPEEQEELKQMEATRIFTILQKLKSKRPRMAAPLHDVFVLIVLEDLSYRAAAKQCHCSLGTLAGRVEELEREFNVPLALLKTYRKPILDMQTSVKGDRHRKPVHGAGPGVLADGEDSTPKEEYGHEEAEDDG